MCHPPCWLSVITNRMCMFTCILNNEFLFYRTNYTKLIKRFNGFYGESTTGSFASRQTGTFLSAEKWDKTLERYYIRSSVRAMNFNGDTKVRKILIKLHSYHTIFLLDLCKCCEMVFVMDHQSGFNEVNVGFVFLSAKRSIEKRFEFPKHVFVIHEKKPNEW